MATAKVILKLKHDKGTAKIPVWANSIDEAINKVINSENAPKSAIIYAKAETPTIYDIKRLTEDTAPHFFTRKTMRFFNQKLSDFSVTRYGNDKFLISAKRPYGSTERIFNPFTNELEHI